MKELLRSRWNYILYEDTNNRLLLSVVCGTVGLFDRNIYLTELERKCYETDGEEYIKKLAREINYEPNKYESRHVKI